MVAALASLVKVQDPIYKHDDMDSVSPCQRVGVLHRGLLVDEILSCLNKDYTKRDSSIY